MTVSEVVGHLRGGNLAVEVLPVKNEPVIHTNHECPIDVEERIVVGRLKEIWNTKLAGDNECLI